jgi:hypothetical protein
MNSQPPAPSAQHDLAAMLAEQRRLTQLGVRDLSQRWEMQPDAQTLLFGSGEPEEQSIRGFPEDAFHGVAVYNPTGRTILVGFNVKAAIGSSLRVPPRTLLVWAAEYTNLSLLADASGPVDAVTVLRLRYPPAQPSATPVTPGAAVVIDNQPEDIAVKLVSVEIAPANADRLGIEVINNGASAVRLALGEAATKKHGLWLAPNGGTWNGQLSAALWVGSIFAICDTGETTVAVVEA